MTDKANSETVETVLDPSRALVPAVVRLNEEKVRRGFWPKLARTAARVPFARELVSVWYCARDPETPAPAKGLMLAALAYFVMPVDAIPDVIAGVGFTDDAAVIAAVVALLRTNLKDRHRIRARETLDRLEDAGSDR